MKRLLIVALLVVSTGASAFNPIFNVPNYADPNTNTQQYQQNQQMIQLQYEQMEQQRRQNQQEQFQQQQQFNQLQFERENNRLSNQRNRGW